jgi:hypothetical protein
MIIIIPSEDHDGTHDAASDDGTQGGIPDLVSSDD